ncbi:hypothetical protein Saro_1986 [Novosphingobium aromaticivorans DSM 12444]|uniref:Uncharacterized protein n=1 Tax=Novosphingobium aromaticivorans (strain ATCC 700278 / DSM 12444 / CCUG 56034 / CIP 105152 / NBRC 16084 / F199) TaxID=279238 RepID=Q2G6U7_NOVAD|nr:hypothetical protein Saro_1986 [Novosphingobium aromaticivorans DSM 12444]
MKAADPTAEQCVQHGRVEGIGKAQAGPEALALLDDRAPRLKAGKGQPDLRSRQRGLQTVNTGHVAGKLVDPDFRPQDATAVTGDDLGLAAQRLGRRLMAISIAIKPHLPSPLPSGSRSKDGRQSNTFSPPGKVPAGCVFLHRPVAMAGYRTGSGADIAAFPDTSGFAPSPRIMNAAQ